MSNDLTAAQKTDILNGVALAQTAYALNNTPGAIAQSAPLTYLDDVAAMNRPGYSPLPMSLPAGFTVTGTYKTSSGGNFFVATNSQTKEIFVGVAGTNGFLADAKDRNSDVVFQGTDQVRHLFSETQFRTDISSIVDGNPSWSVLVAGQSLGGAQAKYIGMALVNGIPSGAEGIEGLSAANLKIVAVNGLNVEVGLELMGYQPTTVSGFASSASIYNLIGKASVQDENYLDAVTRTGGQDIGQSFTFATPLLGDQAPLGVVHRLNGSWSTYYQSDPGLLNLTPISMEAREVIYAQSLYNSLNAFGARLDANGNLVGLTMTGYAAMVFSAPGESGSVIGEYIHASTGMGRSEARGLGYLLEAVGKGSAPFVLKALVANPLVGGALLMLNAFASSKASEAPPTALLQAIGREAPGVKRTYLIDERGNDLAMDSEASGRITFRYIDGSTVRNGESYLAFSKSDGSTAIANDAGGGTIWMAYNGASISVPENSRIENHPLGSAFKIVTPNAGGGRTEVVVNPNSTTSTTVYDASGNITSTSNGTLLGTFSPTDPISSSLQMSVSPNPTAGQGQQSGASGEGAINADDTTLIRSGGVTVSMAGGGVNSDTGNEATRNNVVANGIHVGNVNEVNVDSLIVYADALTDFQGNAVNVLGALGNTASQSGQTQAPTDPLVLDLNGDGVRLTDYGSAPVLFDADHDGGSLEQSGWVDMNDGIVVHDLNSDGVINGIHETLSEYYNGTVGTGGNAGTRPYANGIAALKSLDSNADNVFTSADAAWNNLRVWVDGDHDAVTDAGELRTFAELGITSINLAGTTQSGLIRDGNEVLATSTFTMTVSGSNVTREAIAANFLTNPNGHSFTASGAGTVVLTQGGGTGANGQVIGAVSSYVSHSATGETIDVAAKGVQNAYGSTGNDVLTGDANNNWLAGGLGADTYNAGAGDDVLLIDAADLQANIHAGAGLDIVQVVGDEGVTLNLTQAEVEIAQGGRGNDIFIGGGRSSIFVRGGEGDDILIGGAANDALSGEDGDDLIDGGAGNDIIRGHRGRDVLLGGAGDDLIEGGMEDDSLTGGDGNDALSGGQGDDTIDGGAGTDIAQFSGSFSEYRVTRTDAGVWISDTVSGRDGTDFLKGVEKANFRDVSLVDIPSDTSVGLANPLPVKDVLTKDKNGAALTRGAASFRFTQAQLLGNDVDWQGGALTLNGFSDVQGGTVAIDGANGDVVFTTTAGFNGIYGFKYTVKDAQNNAAATVVNLNTGATAQMKAAVYLKTTDLPSDPLVTDQWYLTQSGILPVWKDYTGKGIRIGQFEPGGNFSVTKEVLDYRHADLQGNIDPVWLANPVAGQRAGEGSGEKFSTHATLVAGVIAADNNGEGAVGVAYDATIAGHWIGRVTETSPQDLSGLTHLLNYDVANNSWTVKPSFAGNFAGGYYQGDIVNAARYGRGGLGTVMVAGGGNDRATGGNANYDNFGNNRYEIQVGAINAVTDLGVLQVGTSPFSNPGASLLVSAPGSNIASTSRLIQNENGSVFGTDYETAQGTSFATPIVSGVVALMLEANPELGYRDVQEILALTAKKVTDPNTVWQDNHATGWNGGALHVSHDYGFGEVDARAAVRLAETWTRKSTLANESSMSASASAGGAAIPDDGGGNWIQGNFTMASGLVVERAEVTLNLTHQQAGDLIVKLISPTGTESVLMNRPGKAPGSAASERGDATFSGSSTLNYTFSSVRNWGEASAGSWAVQVIDAATGQTGTLGSINLTLYGRSATVDDNHVYTDEYAGLAGVGRNTLNDANGGRDTLNASAVTGASTVNLATGTSSIGGTGLTISNPGNIENVFTGDGNDTITGNAASNLLGAGRGTNTLTGGSGQDVFVVQKRANETDTISDFDAAGGERVLLANFDGKQFSDLVLTQQGAHVNVALGGGQALVLQNTTVGALSAAHFEFQDSFQAPRGYVDGSVTLSLPPGGTISGDGSANVLAGTSQADTLDGLGGDDELRGGSGNDILEGGAGNDKLFGEGGNDTLYLDGDSYGLTLNSNGVVFTSGQATGGSGADLYAVRVAGSNLVIDFELENAAEKIDLSAMGVASFGALSFSQSTLNGMPIAVVSSAGQTLVSLLGVYTSQLSAANFVFAGAQSPGATSGADILEGDAGGNTLDGLAGADTMSGRTGDDVYAVDNPGDQVIELPGGGFDTVRASVSYALPAEVENLVLTGIASIDGTGNAQRNRITGNAGGNVLDGGAGSDTLIGGAGNDSYIVDDGSDTVIEQEAEGTDTVQSSVSFALSNHVENLTLTGTHAVNATGNNLANVLIGNANDNRLDGAGGADTMTGGAGDDTYFVDDAGDAVVENASEGIDTVVSSLSTYTVGANVENLTLAIGAAGGTGNALDNVLMGNSTGNTLSGLAGDDYLDGGAGADTLIGGSGNDVYVVDHASDVVTENANEGADTVLSSVSYTLGANVENLTLTGLANLNGIGNAQDNVLLGNAGNNLLSGLAGADLLDGGSGTDWLWGGTGNDGYVVDNVGDVVTEAVSTTTTYQWQNQGYWSGTTWVSNWVQVQTGSSVLAPTAGVAAVYSGGTSSGYQTLDQGYWVSDGEGGANWVPQYVSREVSRTVVTAGDGVDTVSSSVSHSLTHGVENLTLTGIGNINGTGNSLNNVLTGNAGNNTLAGGAGDDTYHVGVGDAVTEAANEGTDTVYSTASFTLGANVENLTLTGTGNVNAAGNTLNNVVTGNSASNTLDGGAGADAMAGGAGDDTYVVDNSGDVVTESANEGIDTVQSSISYTLGANVENLTLTGTGNINATGNALANVLTGNAGNNALAGGAGNDEYLIGSGSGQDTITENDATAGNVDTIRYAAGIAPGSVAASRAGMNLVLTRGADTVTVTDWYASAANKVEQVAFADGTVWDVAAVRALANFAPTVANPIADQTATAESAFNLTLAANAFTDGDAAIGETLTLSASRADGSALPGWLTFNAATGAFAGTPGEGDVGALQLRVTATDSVGASVSDTFDLAVLPVNHAPTVGNPIADQSAAEDGAFSFTVPANAFADVDAGDSLSYTATRADDSALPGWLSFNAATRTFSGTPVNGDVGVVSLKVKATDAGGLQVSDTFDLTVTNVNDAPTLANPLADQAATEMVAFSFTAPANTFADVDAGDTLTYSATRADGSALPEWLAFNAGTRTFSGTPGGADVGSLSIRLTATDQSGASANDVFDIGVQFYGIQGTSGNDTLTGTGGNDNLFGLAGNDLLSGLAGADLLDGGAGTDWLWGGAGNDGYVVENAGDVVTEAVTTNTTYQWQNQGYWSGTTWVSNWVQVQTGSSVLAPTAGVAAVYSGGTSSGYQTLDQGYWVSDGEGGANWVPVYVSREVSRTVVTAGDGVDTVSSSVSHSLTHGLENLTLTGIGNINGTGNSLNNTLTGNTGDNVLDGGAGVDAMEGHAGNDTYVVDNAGDTVTENANAGIDTVQSSISYTLGANVENLTLTGSGSINGTGNALDNVLTGNSGMNALVGGAGNDTYVVQNTSDTVTENANEGIDTVLSSASFVLGANVENLTLTGSAGINGTGNALDNVLTGNAGTNTLAGGAGNDTYYVSTGDTVIENANEGADLVYSDASFTLGANLENLTLTGTGNINGTGNAANNVLTGNAGNNVLDGGAGADAMEGGAGNDNYVVDSAGDTVTENANEGIDTVQSSVSWTLGANVENLTLTGSGNINGTGNSLNNTLTGNSGTNVLAGGAGDDVYVVGTGDTVTENANEGADTVQSSIAWTLGANLETLTLTGTGNINGTGNALANVITGNSGINTLAGGAGDDTYYVQNGADVVSEAAGEGADLVYSDTSYTIGANVESLTLTGVANLNGTGNAQDNVLTGNAGNNLLSGLAGADLLDGGSGTDWLWGGSGNDGYVVDNAGDVVTEAVSAITTYQWQNQGYWSGTTWVSNWVQAQTGSSVLAPTAGVAAVYSGGTSSGYQTLDQGYWVSDGEGGANWVPVYVSREVSRTVVTAGDGVDTTYASVSHSLTHGTENLTLTGTGNNNGTGNSHNNHLLGNSGNNTLTGAAGIDALEGGGGDDTLSDAAGSDAGYLAGGAGNDTLNGGSGREFLAGGAGNDTINAGDGLDIVAFNRGDGQDSVTSGGTAQDNILSLGGGIRYADLKFRKVSDDLVLDTGQAESVTLKNWYASGKRFATLQVVIEASADYNAGSSDTTLNQKVQRFNMDSLATAFDQARAADPLLTEWALSSALTQFHLGGSDTEALGGDLAYYLGKNGSLSTMGFDKALEVLGASQFGQQAQTVRPWEELQQGVARFSQ